jgi:uncharacterized protein YigE (DUF2233 family)
VKHVPLKLSLSLICLPLLLQGCGDKNEAAANAGQQIAGTCRAATFENSDFTDCIAAPKRQKIRTILNGKDDMPLRDLSHLKSSLGNESASVAFAMNAGMFDDAGKPIGYYVEDNNRSKKLNRNKGGGNFHLLPNGVFYGDDMNWHIKTADDFADAVTKRPYFGTQSGPMLLINGALHPKIAEDGQSVNIRNAVGIDAQGRAHFVISEVPVSFGRLARYMRDELHCTDALYLDGTVSSLWYPAGGRLDSGFPLGPLIAVMKTAKEPK